jgi:Asp-tRNA(Asn)/Glu-tRNA(Gln) amidotransferase A subunit family amidase
VNESNRSTLESFEMSEMQTVPPLQVDIDLSDLTIESVQAGFAQGRFTAESLTNACFDRIAIHNATYNALVFLNHAALDDARAIDRRRAAGEVLGPLAGVPVVIKDPMDMIGFPTTAGWSLLYSKTGGVDLMPATDSPVLLYKTLASVGKIPPQGYAANLRDDALQGKRIGLYGPGWRTQPLSDEASQLYLRVQQELKEAGAILIDDPFAGSGFAELREPTPPLPNFDARGLESIPYDVEQYLRRLGPNAALKTFAEFAEATASQDAFGPKGVLSFMHSLPQFAAALENPSMPPDISEFIELKAKYLRIFDAVMAGHALDALAFPQMRCELPPLHGKDTIQETTVGEINIAGLPGITVPAGYYASGSPFGVIFVGRQWDEAALVGIVYAYEQSTRHRKTPSLS